MSLKAFHIVFIICSTILALFLGVWSVQQYMVDGRMISLACAALSVVGLGGLLWYGKYFMRKLKHIQYL